MTSSSIEPLCAITYLEVYEVLKAAKMDSEEGCRLIFSYVNFEPVPVPENNYGKFHVGDSYIVLHTIGNGNLSWDIYFWQGSQTSVDEAGAAARLSVDLDDSLGGAPIQHREVQDHESNQFVGLFPSGVRYVPGGVASGFQHVTANAPGEKRLYHIKGKRHIRTTLVEPKVESMNKGDCFVLDSGTDLYLYFGPDSKGVESHTARRVANQIRDQDHSGKANIVTIDESSSESEVAEFLSKIGANSLSDIPDASTAGDDLEFEKKLEGVITLYKVSDEGGKMRTEKVGEKPLKKQLLDTNDCFILDAGTSGIFVWVGKKSNAKEKAEALSKGQAFINEKNYPSWTSLRRVVQEGEPTIFKENFIDWTD